GIGVLSTEGNLVEHWTFGASRKGAVNPEGSPGLTQFIRFLLQQASPVWRNHWPDTAPPLEMAPDCPQLGSILGIPLVRPGPFQGALYLVRSSDQPPFGPRDEETIRGILEWVDQEKQLEESALLAQLGLLNQVAQAVAGNLDLSRILRVALRELERHFPLS